MTMAPITMFHVAAGGVGLLSGAAALSFRKGSHRHRLMGNVFFISMSAMAASGAYIAYSMQVMLSFVVGILTVYLVATAWAAARGAGKPGPFELGALLVALAVGSASLMFGFEATNSETGLKDGYPAGQYYFWGSVALLAGASDIRLFVIGGVTGARRIARHLWRMCFALFIAAASFFLGQAHLFPAAVRASHVLYVPVLLTLLLMLYWLVRVRFKRRYRGIAAGMAPRTDKAVTQGVYGDRW